MRSLGRPLNRGRPVESRIYLKDLLATLPEPRGGVTHRDISEDNHRCSLRWRWHALHIASGRGWLGMRMGMRLGRCFGRPWCWRDSGKRARTRLRGANPAALLLLHLRTSRLRRLLLRTR